MREEEMNDLENEQKRTNEKRLQERQRLDEELRENVKRFEEYWREQDGLRKQELESLKEDWKKQERQQQKKAEQLEDELQQEAKTREKNSQEAEDRQKRLTDDINKVSGLLYSQIVKLCGKYVLNQVVFHMVVRSDDSLSSIGSDIANLLPNL